MRIPFLILIIAIIINAAIDGYIYCLLKKRAPQIWSRIYLFSSIIFAVGLLSLLFIPTKTLSEGSLLALMWVIFIYVTVYVPKLIVVIFDLISRVPQLIKKPRMPYVTTTGAVIGAIIFLALWWGALFNRFNINVNEVEVPIENLPPAFNGFTIAQISDLHVGTYGENTSFLNKLVNEINSLHPDAVLFTGDIVNRRTSELAPFTNVLSGIKAKYGVYSVLGNHDYGDYYQWPDSVARIENNRLLAKMQREMGWKLLNNSHSYITAGTDTLVIIGVENIGDPPFHVYGNLDKAYPTLTDSLPKILMSHNPAHWTADIADSNKNIGLTLSGHTHAMQISIFGFSPSKLRYKTWGGLYEDNSHKHMLYVNIGAGTVGFPARIGATPEITLLTLTPKR